MGHSFILEHISCAYRDNRPVAILYILILHFSINLEFIRDKVFYTTTGIETKMCLCTTCVVGSVFSIFNIPFIAIFLHGCIYITAANSP